MFTIFLMYYDSMPGIHTCNALGNTTVKKRYTEKTKSWQCKAIVFDLENLAATQIKEQTTHQKIPDGLCTEFT